MEDLKRTKKVPVAEHLNEVRKTRKVQEGMAAHYAKLSKEEQGYLDEADKHGPFFSPEGIAYQRNQIAKLRADVAAGDTDGLDPDVVLKLADDFERAFNKIEEFLKTVKVNKFEVEALKRRNKFNIV